MRTFVIAFATLLAVIAGCNQPAAENNAPNSDPATEVAVTPVNTHCPIMGGPVTEEGGTVEWNGKTIGFCCDGCDEKWEKLSDEEKAAKLAEAEEKGDEGEHAGHDHS